MAGELVSQLEAGVTKIPLYLFAKSVYPFTPKSTVNYWIKCGVIGKGPFANLTIQRVGGRWYLVFGNIEACHDNVVAEICLKIREKIKIDKENRSLYKSSMARRRERNSGMPMHLENKNGWYYYVYHGVWHPLKTADKSVAFKRWAELEGSLKNDYEFDVAAVGKLLTEEGQRKGKKIYFSDFIEEFIVKKSKKDRQKIIAKSTMQNYMRMSFILIKHFEGFYIFSEKEFDSQSKIEALCRTIETEIPLKLFSKKNTVIRLNDVLRAPDLFDRMKDRKTIKVSLDIEGLLKATQSLRRQKFEGMPYPDRIRILRLNRLLIESAYAAICPKHVIQKRYLHAIASHEVEEYYDTFEDVPYEGNRQLVFLNQIFSRAVRKGFAEINPVDGIDEEDTYAEKRHELKLTAPILFDVIYPAAETMLKRAIMLAFHLVQHENEVKNLKWRDFKDYRVAFKRQKTGEEVRINYRTNDALVDFLGTTERKRSEICPYIIFHRDLKGGFIPYQSFRSMWVKALVKAGYKPGDFLFKEIRHLANTLMKDAGVQIDKRKAMTGHITDEANYIYTHETDADTLDASRALAVYRPTLF